MEQTYLHENNLQKSQVLSLNKYFTYLGTILLWWGFISAHTDVWLCASGSSL